MNGKCREATGCVKQSAYEAQNPVNDWQSLRELVPAREAGRRGIQET